MCYSVVVADWSASFLTPIHGMERGHLDKVVAAWPLFAAFIGPKAGPRRAFVCVPVPPNW
jgi:hypothetical protein